MIAAVDVDYRDPYAVAAGIWFPQWDSDQSDLERVISIDSVAPYEPGAFYRRELPCLLKVLELGQNRT